MTIHHSRLPQLADQIFLTDGGIETSLIFLDGVTLRDFAAFELLTTPEGRERLRTYYRRYADIAAKSRLGFVFESPTWRASQDWGNRLGYSAEALDRVNRDGIKLMRELSAEYGNRLRAVISGCVGPRGDGYNADFQMSEAAAEDYHSPQIASFARAGAEMIAAVTMTYSDEAIGIVRAAAAAKLPAAVSFTVETDGRLPSGESLARAIAAVDAACWMRPAYYMINCAHPSHFERALAAGDGWLRRIGGIRANASRKSHAELNDSTELDIGNPAELGRDYRSLRRLLPRLTVLGGCCGTDERHVQAICDACHPIPAETA